MERISVDGREIILVGTAHVSRESIAEVRKTIQDEAPSMVCVELDEGRYQSMIEKDNWSKLNVMKVFREGKGFLLMANLVLGSFQRRMGNELGVKPGEEMQAAIDTAKEMEIPFSLADREIQITLRRAWAKCNFWNKCKLLATLLASAFTTEKLTQEEIEGLKNHNELDGMMAELANYLPSVKEALIDERDAYLAKKIYDAAPEGGKTVAVLGAGHIPGIKRILGGNAVSTLDLGTIEAIPPKSFIGKHLNWLFPILILGLIVIGFIRAGADVSLSMLLRWLLLNGGLAVLGSIIALAHPLTLLVSFVGAPIGTLSPILSIGIFAGMTEAWVRKPRVEDAENINTDVTSIKGMYKNRIIHALLVFFLAGIGGAIGNIIAVPSLAGLLFK